MGIYTYKNNAGMQRIETRIRGANYPEANKKMILLFESFLFAEGLKTIRVLKYMMQMNTIAEIINQAMSEKEFQDMNRMDIQILLAQIERSNRAEWTKHDYKVAIKRFFSWLKQNYNTATDVEWIRTNLKRCETKLPEEMITESEVKLMLEAANHPRNKAIIALLYDSGCRVGELGNMKIKHATFDQYGGILLVSGKTGMRRVRIIFSVPYLTAWLDIHPNKNNQDAWVWVPVIGKGAGVEQMQYPAIRKMLAQTAKKAGIKKRIHPHLFRHSRSTELAQHLTEAQMEEHLGWVHGSNMPSIYVHLSGKQVDDAMLRIYGMKKKEDLIPELISKACPICEKINGPTSKFCSRCGHPLDHRALQDIQEIENRIPELLKLILKNDQAREFFSKLDKLE